MPWISGQSVTPWNMWNRTSGIMKRGIQDMENMVILRDFFRDSTKDIKIWTQQKNDKNQYLDTSSEQ